MDIYQQFIHKSRYARWLEKENRRETWEETVKRYFDFFEKHLEGKKGIKEQRKELEQAVLDMEIMPSMRSLMTAGEALERDNVAGYNCAYLAVNKTRAFDECLFILMCGTGVGFSVERREVEKLPEVPDELFDTDTTIVVADSKIGWAKAYKELIQMLYAGQIAKWDMSKVRPAGERLKTFGGRSSGQEPLDNLFRFTVEIFKNARVVITGHTGFKGSWLTAWLKELGANVMGISLDPHTSPSHFEVSKIGKGIRDVRLDIRNRKKLEKKIITFKQQFVFHLAAQALVRKSY